MARKKKPEEHENHERWLVSYADFITLLFAFFVVMYSISSINEGKYRVLSDAIIAAFRSPAKSLEPVQIGKLTKSPNSSPIDMPGEYRQKIEQMMRERAIEPPIAVGEGRESAGEGGASEAVKSLSGEIRDAVQALLDRDLVKVRAGKNWLEIEIQASVLFPSGSAALNEDALPVLRRIAQVLAPHGNPLQVEGHTDSLPIRSLVYPSNWELSAARAASVVQLFVQYGLSPARMAAVGYGEHRPVADNATAEGRSRNRRVSLVVLAIEETAATADAGAAEAQPAQATREAAQPPAPRGQLSPISAPTLPGISAPAAARQ